jgi:succinate dehydrogenase / fumarate reductase membrane anchor subunit
MGGMSGTTDATAQAPAPARGVQVGRSGRVRPAGDRRELAIWYLMRLSGLGLFVLVLTHYLILHVLYDPAEQDASWIGEMRWSSTFWRVFDWLMLTLVLFHAFVGMRIVVSDVTGGPVRRVLLWALYALAILLFVLGTIVVATLPNVVPAG